MQQPQSAPGAAPAAGDVAYRFWRILHGGSEGQDPMVDFAVKLKQELQEAQAATDPQMRDHLEKRLGKLKDSERDLTRQIDVKSHAQERLQLELRKYEATLKQLREQQKALQLEQQFTEACLRDIARRDSSLRLDIINATGGAATRAPGPAGQGAQQRSASGGRQGHSTAAAAAAGGSPTATMPAAGDLGPAPVPMQQAAAFPAAARGAAAGLRPMEGAPGAVGALGQQQQLRLGQDVQRIENVLWHIHNKAPELQEAVRQSLHEFERYCNAVAETHWDDATYSTWVRCAHSMAMHIQSPGCSQQVVAPIVRCLTEMLRRWNHISVIDKEKDLEDQAARRDPGPQPQYKKDAALNEVVIQCRMIEYSVKLLQSVSDEVRADTAQFVNALTSDNATKEAFGTVGGVHALVSILNKSTHEVVLEKALMCLWHLAMSDANKTAIREAGGLVAIVQLLHSENDVILENATIALGYLTRDDSNKIAIRKCNGLEKLIATLYYPSDSIQSKAAGALWNCASNAENKVVIRQLGAIAAFIDLLSSHNESVQENAAGGLWNCAVDTENKRLVRELGGLGPLIQLLMSPMESVVENASGTLWNCAAVGDNRVAIRKLGGLDPLLKLLTSRNENIQENAAGAIRNCAINDQNKVALKDLGALQLFIELMDTSRYSVLEKLTSTLWICSISNENKNVIRECGGFPRLLRALDHEQISIREKALGILRNCSTLAENRLSLIQCGVVRKLVQILEAPPEQLTNGMKEYAAATLWNVARDDKVSARVEGALPALTHLLADKTESVVENAAGALLSLTLNPENREHLRDCGGVHALCRLLQSKNEFILENVAGALKNCCNGSPANQRLVKDLNAIPHIIALLRLSGENVVRETALTLKNMASSDDCSEAIGRAGGVAELVRLAEQSDTDALRKVASFAIASLAKHPHNRAQVPPELLRHHSSHRDPRGGGEDGHHSARGR